MSSRHALWRACDPARDPVAVIRVPGGHPGDLVKGIPAACPAKAGAADPKKED